MTCRRYGAAAACGLVVLLAAMPAVSARAGETAALQALDKILGRTSTLEAKVGEAIHFGTLEIVVRACRTRPPEEPPESTAFLEIADERPGEAKQRVFTGWMFASSPAVSALEHPVYDVWVKACQVD